jgi:hypothetical protein
MLQRFANENNIGVIISFSCEYNSDRTILGGKIISLRENFAHPFSVLNSTSRIFPISLRVAGLVESPSNIDDLEILIKRVNYSKSLELLMSLVFPLIEDLKKIITQINAIDASIRNLEARMDGEAIVTREAPTITSPTLELEKVKKRIHSFMYELKEIDYVTLFRRISMFPDNLEYFNTIITELIESEKKRLDSWEDISRVPFQFKLPTGNA